jgi:ABC-type antimicrobial peptide transport system permease subunit
VMRQGLRLIAAGGAVGIAIAASLNRTLASLLFGVSPLDVSTYALALGAMTILGVIALMLPAWTAARVAPTVVLRDH